MHQLNADFLFEIADLPAEGWLRSVQLLLGGNGQAARISYYGPGPALALALANAGSEVILTGRDDHKDSRLSKR
jgi:hypothetical protein